MPRPLRNFFMKGSKKQASDNKKAVIQSNRPEESRWRAKNKSTLLVKGQTQGVLQTQSKYEPSRPYLRPLADRRSVPGMLDAVHRNEHKKQSIERTLEECLHHQQVESFAEERRHRGEREAAQQNTDLFQMNYKIKTQSSSPSNGAGSPAQMFFDETVIQGSSGPALNQNQMPQRLQKRKSSTHQKNQLLMKVKIPGGAPDSAQELNIKHATHCETVASQDLLPDAELVLNTRTNSATRTSRMN